MYTTHELEVQQHFPALTSPELVPIAHWLLQQVATCRTFSLQLQGEGIAEKASRMIGGKVVHTNDVIAAMHDILGDDEENLAAAEAIALLHDSGRFPQALTGSFMDTEQLNHARMGVDLVHGAVESGELQLPFSQDTVLELLWAINEHSKYTPVIKESELLHLCRDADKLAILRKNAQWLTATFAPGVDEPKVSSDVLTAVLARELVPHGAIITKADWLLSRLGFVFDFHFQKTKEIYVAEGLLDELLQRLQAAIGVTQPKELAAVEATMLAWKQEVEDQAHHKT